MKQVQQDYKTIRAQAGSYYKVRVVAAGNTYGMDKLSRVRIDPALFEGSGPQIGNAYATQCDMELYVDTANWPRMCRFTVDVQLCSADGQQTTAWLPMGAFYTDTRSDNTYGLLTVHAYDGMLKMEKSWTDRVPENLLPSSWPITSRAWASMIQTAGLATFEDLTALDNTVAFIGLNTASSIRDVLKTIAAANGGNWMMTTDERLRFVNFRNPAPITTEATTADYVWVGRSVSGFHRSPALSPVTGVHLEAEDGTVSAAGGDSGYVLNGSCDFATNVGVAAVALGNTNGYAYRPFEASNAILDPITELGDTVVIDGQGYQVMRLSWTLGKLISSDVAADYDEEVDHEYQMPNQQAKAMRKTLAKADERYLTEAKFATEIQQTSSQIRLSAESVFPTYSFVNEELQHLQDQIDGNIQTWSGNVVPTLSNAPASEWTSQTDKAAHVGDLYFVNSDSGIPEAGQYYRFEDNDGVYSWQILSDSALTEALTMAAAAMAAAEDAQSTADDADATAQLKGRIWVNQPTPPYSVGDLWFNSAQSEILTCMTAREDGNFVAADWVKRNKYTDDSAFDAFYASYQDTIDAIQDQVDKKADTYYQANDPAAAWGATIVGWQFSTDNKTIVGWKGSTSNPTIVGVVGGQEYTGDLWYRTTDNTTWYWNGTTWLQQAVPDDVFDQIDGKASVYIVQPTPPYNERDLWFDASTRELLTCVRGRIAGESFWQDDWQKKNKYTDDTKALDVEQQLTQFHSEFVVATDNISAEVEKRVIGDNYEHRQTFGWRLTSDAHTWYANNKQVMKISQQDGLEVEGKITATSGLIGDCEIKNGKLVIGVSNVKEKVVMSSYTRAEYYLSTSSSSLSGGSWSTSIPTWQTGRYIWTRNCTVTVYSDSATPQYSYSPSSTGVYDRNLTEALSKSTTAQDSNKRQQTIYRSTSGGSIPEKPNSWVTDQTGGQNKWTAVRPEYSQDFPVLYTATQSETVSGTVTCTDPKIDATTTVIDGGHVITGTLDASAIATGDLSAGKATIGGFKISSSTSQGVRTGSIAYGKTSIGDSNAGVYIGTNGISLGADNVFKVTSAGAVTASNLTLTGGTINIKNGNTTIFKVNTGGSIVANFTGGTLNIGEKIKFTNGTATIGGFTIGTDAIYSNNKSTDESTRAGIRLSATGIRLGTNFRVDEDGNLYANNAHLSGTLTIGGNAAITQADLYNAIYQSSQNYSKWNGTSTSYGNATNSQSSTIPAYFRAKQIVASTSFYSKKYAVDTGDDNTEYDLEDHYHTFTAQNDGKVYIGKPTKTQGFFNIADTAFYKNAISAVKISTVTSTTYSTTADHSASILGNKVQRSGDMVYGRLSLQLSNDKSETLYVGMESPGSSYTDEEKSITSNGNYYPSSSVRWSKVTVNVPQQDIGVPSFGTITENGTYYASEDGLDGFSAVTVDVPTGGGGSAEIYNVDDVGYSSSSDFQVSLNDPYRDSYYSYGTMRVTLSDGTKRTITAIMENAGGGGGGDCPYPVHVFPERDEYGSLTGTVWIRMSDDSIYNDVAFG